MNDAPPSNPHNPPKPLDLLKNIPRNLALRPLGGSDPTCLAKPRSDAQAPWESPHDQTVLARQGKPSTTQAFWKGPASEDIAATGAYIPLRLSAGPTTGPLQCPYCPRVGERLGERCVEHDRFLVPQEELIHAKPGHALGRMLGDKYVILGTIGSGGMGTVYWGIQRPIGRRVAIKVMRADLTDKAAERRFMREAQAISSIIHPHLVTCYDYGVQPDRMAYMVLEYIQGRSLQKLLRRSPLSMPDILHVTRQLLEGLAMVHAAQVIHRDLKPSNIMLCRMGHHDRFVKIIDFGLARMLDGQKLTVAGEIFGTPRYMSPEQARGDSHIGPQADIYALGIILYEMICGDAPFDGKPMVILQQQQQTAIPPLQPRPGLGDIPPALLRFIERTLAKRAQDRFHDGNHALTAFTRLGKEGNQPTDSFPPFLR